MEFVFTIFEEDPSILPVMRKTIPTILLSMAFIFNSFSQKSDIELVFTAVNNIHYAQLDSIKVINKSNACDTVLYWPDTVLRFFWVGMNENHYTSDQPFDLQCNPNPVSDQALIRLKLKEADNLDIIITDLSGKTVWSDSRLFSSGLHCFSFIPGNQKVYIITAINSSSKHHVKVVNLDSQKGALCTMKYSGPGDGSPGDGIPYQKSSNSRSIFQFEPGDELLFKGYVDGIESGILDAPQSSELYVFQFAANMPCPGTPTVDYQGRTYHTVQIYSQCWMSQNLNAGVKIWGDLEQTDNDMIERYCLYDDLDSCEKYGGLYQWLEMMDYGDEPGCQGICPPGWHIPTQDEWKLLEGATDSDYGIGNPEWDLYWTMRGSDVGLNLKSRDGWTHQGNGINEVGFNAKPGGQLSQYHFFGWERRAGNYWTSTKALNNTAWYIDFYHSSDQSGLSNHFYNWGFSVRCLKDQ